MYILLLLAVMLAAVTAICRAYINRWSDGLDVDISFSQRHYSEGDEGSVIETVTNRKLLPLWWGSLEFHLPPFVEPLGEGYHGNADFRDSFSVFSYEQVERRVPFTALTRGYFKMNGAEMLTHDPLFTYRLIRRFAAADDIYVYPDPKRAAKFFPDFRRITGDVVSRRHYMEDELSFRGIRDYSPSDSMRRVNWSATARTGGLKVNEYNFTVSQEVRLLLDFDPHGSWDRLTVKETLIRSAAALCVMLNKEGIPVGIVTNAADSGSGGALRLPCRGGQRQLDECLRLLTRIDAAKTLRPFAEELEELRSDPAQSEYIVLSISRTEELAQKLRAFRASGRLAGWLVFADSGDGRDDIPPFEGLTVCEVI